MISFVNGFMCTSSCDVDKAKRGIDPHPNMHGAEPAAEEAGKAGAPSSAGDPAVVFGGALAAVSGATAASAVAPASAAPQVPAQLVDLLA